MGIKFGNLAYIRGIVFFRLSPHEQKAFGGMLSKGIPNMIRRVRSSMWTVAPPFFMTYLVMSWADEEYAKSLRKNPKDYENDE